VLPAYAGQLGLLFWVQTLRQWPMQGRRQEAHSRQLVRGVPATQRQVRTVVGVQEQRPAARALGPEVGLGPDF